MKIADTIKTLREINNLTQEELGKIAGVSFQAVSSWERGEREPRMGAIERMSNSMIYNYWLFWRNVISMLLVNYSHPFPRNVWISASR